MHIVEVIPPSLPVVMLALGIVLPLFLPARGSSSLDCGMTVRFVSISFWTSIPAIEFHIVPSGPHSWSPSFSCPLMTLIRNPRKLLYMALP